MYLLFLSYNYIHSPRGNGAVLGRVGASLICFRTGGKEAKRYSNHIHHSPRMSGEIVYKNGVCERTCSFTVDAVRCQQRSEPVQRIRKRIYRRSKRTQLRRMIWEHRMSMKVFKMQQRRIEQRQYNVHIGMSYFNNGYGVHDCTCD